MTNFCNFIPEKTIPVPKPPTPEELRANTERFRREHASRLNSLGRHFIHDPLSEYDKKIAEKALADCKSWAEWKALEADDIRIKTTALSSNNTVETSAFTPSSFCFCIIELKPPIVSSTKSDIDPERSSMNTISVNLFVLVLLLVSCLILLVILTRQSYIAF